MGLLSGKKIVVMGLLDANSIAWAIGQAATREGAQVVYTVQNERYLRTILLKSFRENGLDINDYIIHECDIQDDEQIERLFKKFGSGLHGLVYSIAYANPKTCLGENPLWTAPREDVIKAVDISALGLAYVAGQAKERMINNGSIVALTFESGEVFPGYGWMGVAKKALEGVAINLAYELGEDGIRVNCLSSGPLRTKAALNIPGIDLIREAWNTRTALDWDPITRHKDVADSAVYLLSDLSKAVTGTTHYVDGGFHVIATKKAQ